METAEEGVAIGDSPGETGSSPSETGNGRAAGVKAESAPRIMTDPLTATAALVAVLDHKGRVLMANPAFDAAAGRPAGASAGMRIWDLFDASEVAVRVAEIFSACRSGRAVDQIETPLFSGACGNRRVLWSVARIGGQDGVFDRGDFDRSDSDRGYSDRMVWIGLDITRRWEAEAVIRDSEARYRALVENVKDGVGLIEDGSIRFANNAFLSMFGYPDVAAAAGKPMRDLVEAEFRERFDQFLGIALDEKSWGLNFRGRCRAIDGREVWTEMLTSAIRRDGGGPAILLTVRDITENMLWEQTIKEEAEYFRGEAVRLKSSIGERYRLLDIVGKSRVMRKVYEMILDAAATDASVIIFGRSGTGKELVARAIHQLSARADKPFVPVNCGAIPESLIESEFFGHRKGAFTGAHMDKAGYFAAAHTGTLFLDEVGEIGLNMQVKLLRALESGEYAPVGDRRPRTADARIIAATNKEPMAMVRAGLMREDFFYRISVIPITVPPLRDRREDVPLLVEHFLRRFAGKGVARPLPPGVMDRLLQYDWPGNVRELQNVLQRFLTVRSLDFIRVSGEEAGQAGGGAFPGAADDGHLSSRRDDGSPFPQRDDWPLSSRQDDGSPFPQRDESAPGGGAADSGAELDLRAVLDRFEAEKITAALADCRYNRTRAAETLGLSRRALFRRMKRLGL